MYNMHCIIALARFGKLVPRLRFIVAAPVSEPTHMQGDCTLTDGYAFVIQVLVGLLAISTLLIKRHCEWPQRPWIVWLFDASKQVLASASMHVINVLAAYIIDVRLGDGDDDVDGLDQCVWYLTSILIDGTLLVSIMATLVTLQGWWAERNDIKALRQGEYGDPPEWRIWVQQLSVYSLFLFASKAVCLWVLHVHGSWYKAMALALVWPFMAHRRLKLLLVLLGIPTCMMAAQYWLMDSLLKANWRSLWMRRVTEGWSLILPAIFAAESEEEEEARAEVGAGEERERALDRRGTYPSPHRDPHGLSYYVLGTTDHFHWDDKDDESYTRRH